MSDRKSLLAELRARLEIAERQVRAIIKDDRVMEGRIETSTLGRLSDIVGLGMMSPQQATLVGCDRERRDVLAYLRQRLRAAETVAARNPEEAERAKEIARSIGIQIEHIEQGLHEGSAAVQATLSEGGLA